MGPKIRFEVIATFPYGSSNYGIYHNNLFSCCLCLRFEANAS